MKAKSLFAAVAACVAATCAAEGAFRLAGPFGEHAVLQRGKAVSVWGEGARPYDRVTLSCGPARAVALADPEGRFFAKFAPQKAGGPFTLVAESSDGRRTERADIWFGEVWFASGQSNMALRMRATDAEPATADNPLVRVYYEPPRGAHRPLSRSAGSWCVATKDAVSDFSAVGYLFAERLQREFPGVAVGVMVSALGGTTIDSWSADGDLAASKPGAKIRADHLKRANDPDAWQKNPQPTTDLGVSSEAADWTAPGIDLSDWKKVSAPEFFASKKSLGRRLNGAGWLRRTVEIPVAWAGQDLQLGGGRVDKQDVVWFNGVRVGATGEGFSDEAWNTPRVYTVPGKLVKGGTATVAVRVWSYANGFGLHGRPEELFLKGPDGVVLPLAGDMWYARIERDIGAVSFASERLAGNLYAPSSLYNAMVAPLEDFTVRGIIWYQGCSDVGRENVYRELESALINGWRTRRGAPALPFCVVQLAGYGKRGGSKADCALAEMRAAQLAGAHDVQAGCVTAVDTGLVDNLHPRDKRPVVERLVAWALVAAYGKGGEGEGPEALSAASEGAAVRIRFARKGGGLVARGAADGAVGCCALIGADGVCHAANARLEKNGELVVSSPEVASPRQVLYAWTGFPEGNNLYRRDGVPVFPFSLSLDGSGAWKPLVSSAPVLQNAAETSMGVAFAVSADASGWVDCGEKPDLSDARRFHSGDHGLMTVDDKIAQVRLTGLKPATKYYYRVGADRIFFKDGYWMRNLGPEPDPKVHSFTTLGTAATGSFCVINDTHNSKTALKLVFGKLAELKPSVVLWNGDASDTSEKIEQAIGVFIRPHREFPEYASDTPFMFLNGNHDYRGRFNRQLGGVMMFREPAERKGEYAELGRNFVQRFGDVALIGLDTGEDKLDTNPNFAGIFKMKEYREKQARWLAEAVETEAVKTARFKVALCHIPLFDARPDANPGDVYPSDSSPKYSANYAFWQRTCATLWGPSFEKAGVQLVIAAHEHEFRYDAPAAGRSWAQIVGGGCECRDARFPTVIEGKVEGDRLVVTVHDALNRRVAGRYEYPGTKSARADAAKQ